MVPVACPPEFRNPEKPVVIPGTPPIEIGKSGLVMSRLMTRPSESETPGRSPVDITAR